MLYQILTRQKSIRYLENNHYVELHNFDTDEEAAQWCKENACCSECICLRIEVGKPAIVSYAHWVDYTDEYKKEKEEARKSQIEYEKHKEAWKNMPWYKKIFNLGKVL